MPRKRDYNRTYGQKLITLYTRLMFSGQRHSLTELAKLLDCSKQTVLRLVDEINTGPGLVIQELKMEERKVCKVQYQSISENKPKIYFIKPLKLFSHHDTIYLHARIAKTPGKKYQEPDYDPLLAIHRFKDVEITNRVFEFSTDYDFEKIFNRQFGIIKDEVFEVVVELTGWAARYVSERIWSPDQKIEKKGKDKIRLTFKASSESEVTGWLLSFGDEAKLIEPGWLVRRVSSKLDRLKKIYKA